MGVSKKSPMREIEFKDGSRSDYWGYGDFYLYSKLSKTKILLPYKSEPPHGDSYHQLIINEKTIRGYIWCGYLLWSKCGNYFTCDWLEGMKGYFNENKVWHSTQVQRATILVSPEELKYKIVLKPNSGDLHKMLKRHCVDDVWETLLNKSEIPWEDFC